MTKIQMAETSAHDTTSRAPVPERPMFVCVIGTFNEMNIPAASCGVSERNTGEGEQILPRTTSGGTPWSKPGQEIRQPRGPRREPLLRQYLALFHIACGSAVQFDFHLLLQVLVVILKNFHHFSS